MNKQSIVVASTAEIGGSRSEVFEAGIKTSNLPDMPSLKIDSITDTLERDGELKLQMRLAKLGFSVVSTVKQCSPEDGVLIEGGSRDADIYFHLGFMYNNKVDETLASYELGVTPRSFLAGGAHRVIECALREIVPQFTGLCVANIEADLQSKTKAVNQY